MYKFSYIVNIMLLCFFMIYVNIGFILFCFFIKNWFVVVLELRIFYEDMFIWCLNYFLYGINEDI